MDTKASTRSKLAIAALALGILYSASIASAVEGEFGRWASTGLFSGKDITTPDFDVVIDEIGKPHVVYAFPTATGGTGVGYSTFRHSFRSWDHSEIVAGTASDRRRISLAATTDGTLHLSYVRINSAGMQDLYHGKKERGGGWTISQVATASPAGLTSSGAGTSIDATSAGLAVIAYTATGNTLRVAFENQDGSWTDLEADGRAETGFYPSLESTGSVSEPIAIAHHKADSEDLLVTVRKRFLGIPPDPPIRFEWQTETVDSAGRTGLHPSLKRLGNGRLAVAHQRLIGGSELQFAERNDDGDWERITVDDSGDEPDANPRVGRFCELSSDARGNPQITYPKEHGEGFAFVTDGLRHARRLPDGRWVVERAYDFFQGDPPESNFMLASTTNAAGTPYSIYYRGAAGMPSDLRWARPHNGAWIAEDLTDRIGVGLGTDQTGACLGFSAGGTRIVIVGSADAGTLEGVTLADFADQSNERTSLLSVTHRTSEVVIEHRGRVQLAWNGSLEASRRLFPPIGLGFIDSSSTLGSSNTGSSIALGPDGSYHQVFESSFAPRRIEYHRAPQPGIAEDLDFGDQTSGAPFVAGVAPSVTVSPDGTVAIAYITQDLSTAMLATLAPGEGATWEQQDVTPAIFSGRTLSPTTDIAWIFSGFQVGIASQCGRYSDIAVVESGDRTEALVGVYGDVRKVQLASTNTQLHVAYRTEQSDHPESDFADRHIGHFELGMRPAFLNVVSPIPTSAMPFDPNLDGFSLALDPGGFPHIVTNITGSGLTPDRTIVFQVADSVDDDHDGIPLLRENAHHTDPDIDDCDRHIYRGLGRTVDRFGETTNFYHFLRFREGTLEPIIGGPFSGEFAFGREFSMDLRGFSPYTVGGLTSALFLPGPGDSEVGIDIAGVGIEVTDAYMSANPRFFFRARIDRVLPFRPARFPTP